MYAKNSFKIEYDNLYNGAFPNPYLYCLDAKLAFIDKVPRE